MLVMKTSVQRLLPNRACSRVDLDDAERGAPHADRAGSAKSAAAGSDPLGLI
jgi:hypothetical protein